MNTPADTRLPWHAPLWETVMARLRAGRMPHAILLAGPAGLGKNHFARRLAQTLLCEHPREDGHACGACRGCRFFLAGTHPDFLLLEPEEAGKGILIDPVRELCASLMLKSQYGGYKTALVAPAERLNVAAANSLLKTLEEPAGQTVLLLVSAQPSALPATLRSRCQTLVFRPPPRELAIAWLAQRLAPGQDAALLLDLNHGAPLAASAMAQDEKSARRASMLKDLEQVACGAADPVAVAAKWLKDGTPDGLYWLQTWVMDMIRLKAARQAPRITNRDLDQRLQQFAKRLELKELYGHLDRLSDAVRMRAGTQANVQLLLEDVLIPWASLLHGGQGKNDHHHERR